MSSGKTITDSQSRTVKMVVATLHFNDIGGVTNGSLLGLREPSPS